MADYCTAEDIEAQVEAFKESDSAVFGALASAVSRLFDKQAECTDNFFAVTDDALKDLDFYAENTKHIRIIPPILSDLTSVSIDTELQDADSYAHDGNFIVLDSFLTSRKKVTVNAKFGFAAIPVDIKQACIEQAIYMWRRKDLNFAEIAGIPSAVVASEFSPTFEAVTRKYRDLYGDLSYF